jgi:hypothetical protein
VDRETEKRHLAEADRHIVIAERNITEQRLQVDRLGQDGHDTRLAQKTLEQFEATLAVMVENREIIIRTIDEIDRGKI